MNRPASWRSMMDSVVDRRPFRVGGATVDPISRDASWNGGEERLQPQTLKVLLTLVSRRGEVVTRDELIQLCWDGRIVGDDVINRSILLLRQFAERAGGFEIETVPRTGYRLIETGTGGLDRVPRFWMVGGAALAAVGVLAAGFLFIRHPSPLRQPTLTVLVAPFVAESNDAASRRLAADAHESVVRMLTQSGLSVETATGGTLPDLQISASLREQQGGALAKLRIEEPAQHAVLYDRVLQADPAHLNDLPDRIGANITAPLSWTAPLIRIDQPHPADPAFTAHMFAPDEPGFGQLRNYQFLRRNAPAAPNSAIAQLALAIGTGFALNSILLQDRPAAIAVARDAASRALQLAPRFGDTAIPWCMLHSPVRKRECEDHLRAGLAADPEAPFAPIFLSDLLNSVGRTGEALDVASVSFNADQYVPPKIGRVVWLSEATGQTAAAEHQYREGQRLWPDFWWLFWARENGIIQRGDLDALERFEREPTSTRVVSPQTFIAPIAEAVRARSLPRLKGACSVARGRDVECMMALVRLGDIDGAYAYANRLYPALKGRTEAEEESLWLDHLDGEDTLYLTVPTTAAMRRDPRFLPLADRVGLLDYWRSGRLPDFCTKAHEPVCARITRKPT
jgi:hypothetical protein